MDVESIFLACAIFVSIGLFSIEVALLSIGRLLERIAKALEKERGK